MTEYLKTVIISHKHKFIFIKTKKTAGTSIEVFLSQFCDENDVLTPIYPAVSPHTPRGYKGYWNLFPELERSSLCEKSTIMWHWVKRKKFRNHASALTISHRVPKHIWNSYYKFCVDRNPWDKTLSHYYMVKSRRYPELTLDQYFKRGNLCLNYPKYCDQKGNIMVDRVLNYENLDHQLAQVCKTLSLPFNDGLTVRAKGDYRVDRRPYQEVFTATQKGYVAEAFSREISMHNYGF